MPNANLVLPKTAGLLKTTVLAANICNVMSDFSTFIRQSTQGRGFFTFEFERYEEAPANVSQKVIAEVNE